MLAFGLMLVFEGVMPLLFPKQWRQAFQRIAEFSDGQIRFFGLIALLGGLVALVLINLFS